MSHKSQRALEGYLLIDHSNSPGTLPEHGGMAVAAGVKMEVPFYTCSHCQTTVIVNPGRTRNPAKCWNCDHVICDRCAAVRAAGFCRTWMAVVEEAEKTIIMKENIARAEAVPLLMTLQGEK